MARPTGSPRLSVALITKDAADLLPETLQSVSDIADDIVVMDTGSADATVAIARELDASVFTHAWKDDFAGARNACLARTDGDWILWLDAGERLSPEDAELVRQRIDNPSKVCAYAMLIEIPPNGTSSSAEQIAQFRLLPRHDAISYVGRVRESPLPSLESAAIPLDSLPVRIRRGAREHDPTRRANKARRNLHLAQLEMELSAPEPRLWNCMGDALQTLDDYTRAAECFRLAWQSSQPKSPEMLEAAYGLLTSLERSPERPDQQLTFCLQALEVFPLDAQLLCALGGYLQRQQRTELALKAYQTAHQFGEVNPLVWHVTSIQEIATNCYCLMLQRLNRVEEAAHVLTSAVQRHPESSRLRAQWIEVHDKLGRVNLSNLPIAERSTQDAVPRPLPLPHDVVSSDVPQSS